MRVMKSKRVKWEVHIARMGEVINTYIFIGKSKLKTQLGNVDLHGRIILKCALNKV
jgi:hypothetical protein